MTLLTWKIKMLGYTLGMAKLLTEMNTLEDIKIEPEQVRKNASTILTILIEVEDFLAKIPESNTCSSSNQSISQQ